MIYFLVGAGLVLFIFILMFILGGSNGFMKEKFSPFECGFDSFKSARFSFSLRFYKIALVFLFFDIEIVLVLPIPMSILMSEVYFCSCLVVLLVVIFGLFFEWKEGSLNWID